MEEIQNPTVEQIREYLAKINWSFYDGGCDFNYLKNHKGEITDWCIWHDRLELKGNNGTTCHFSLKSTKIKILEDGDALAFTAVGSENNVFLLCMNHDIKKSSLTPKEIK
jgi:hypothetical protein